jgi:hypothetical protein
MGKYPWSAVPIRSPAGCFVNRVNSVSRAPRPRARHKVEAAAGAAMESLFKHNLEAAAAAALAEAEQLERSAELASNTVAAAAAAPGPGATTVRGRPRARVIDAAFLTEPLQRPLDMMIVRAGADLELYAVGLGDIRRRSLLTAHAGRKAVAVATSFGPLGTLSHNLLGTNFELHDTEARRHATVAFDVKFGLSAAPRRLRVRLENTPEMVYHSRAPLYDPLTQTYVSDFGAAWANQLFSQTCAYGSTLTKNSRPRWPYPRCVLLRSQRGCAIRQEFLLGRRARRFHPGDESRRRGSNRRERDRAREAIV